MTDRAFEPPSPNPFDQFDPDKRKVMPFPAPASAVPAPAGSSTANPFAQFEPYPGALDNIVGFAKPPPEPDESSATGAFARGAARSAAPALLSFPAIGAGAEAGFAVGGPWGAVAGGVAGALGGGYLLSKAQDYLLSKAPDSWKEAIGLDDRQQKLDQEQHPYASFLGGLAPYALTMKPTRLGKFEPPENATALQRIRAHPATARVFGGAVMGGIELGQEAASGETPDWAKVAISTGFGVIFNKPRRFGESLTEIGAKPARTLIQAWNGKVMGPGVTEEVFRGSHEMAPDAAKAANDAAQTEQSLTGEPAKEDPHAAARRMEADLFRRFDALVVQRNSLQAWNGKVMGPGVTEQAYKHLVATNQELAEIEPQIHAAYRRAAEATGAHILEPEAPPIVPVAEPTTPRTIDRGHDVPYLAGSSNDGRTTYIDKRVPAELTVKGITFDPAKYLDVHETREHDLMTKAGEPYETAHREALQVERAAVEADGIDWNGYQEEMHKLVGETEHEQAKTPPNDLYTKPYPHREAEFLKREGEQTAGQATPEAPAAPRPEIPPLSVLAEPLSQFIRDDVARQLARAGRPAEEAQTAGALIAARYRARAGWFRGALGSAEELYRAEAPEILGPGMRSQQARGAVQPRGPRQIDETKLSLFQFLAHRGGLQRTADLEAVLDKNPFIPGFGRLFREGGMTPDRGRAAAVEAGYLHEAPGETGGGKTTINDLLAALSAESKGRKLYRPGHEPEAAYAEGPEPPKPLPAGAAELWDHFQEQREERDLSIKRAHDLHIKIGGPEYRTRVSQVWEPGNTVDVGFVKNLLIAEERPDGSFVLLSKPDAEGESQQYSARPHEGLVKENRVDFLEATRVLTEPPEEEPYRRSELMRPEDEGVLGEEMGLYQRKRRDLIAEREAEGQMGLPGTERISDAERAQRLANAPLKPTVEQKPMEEGLFGEGAKQRELFQRDLAPPFYSAVERAVTSAKQEKASPEQWLGMLKNMPGVKSEEMEWLGLEDWLKEQKGSVTKGEIADYVRANRIEVKEVEKGGLTPEQLSRGEIRAGNNPNYPFDIFVDGNLVNRATTREIAEDELHGAIDDRTRGESDRAKFSHVTLPGGKSYRELVLTLPGQIEPYKPDAVHFTSEGGGTAVAWVRFNDRVIDGKKTLFVEEVQSKRHQEGRLEGYANQTELPDNIEILSLEDARNKFPERWGRRISDYEIKHKNGFIAVDKNTGESQLGFWGASLPTKEIATQKVLNRLNYSAVPDAPFKTTWPELAMKRMIRYAAENGYDKIAWTTGETQAARYHLSKHLAEIAYWKTPGGHYEMTAVDHDGRVVFDQKHIGPENQLDSAVGKEIADRMIKGEGSDESHYDIPGGDDETPVKFLRGDDLVVGGEGMRGFYDQILPATVNKLVKKFGGRVGKAEIETAPERGAETQQFGGGGHEPIEITTRKGEPATATPVHALDITDKLRDAAVEQGFPLFQGARGKVTFAAGRRPVMQIMREADASTFIHESGHVFLEELLADAEHEKAPPGLKADAATALKWLGAESADALKTKHHEKFARGFEQYMREGIAPSPELASVFARFKDWLLQIYKTIKGLGAPINDDIRGVFDRLLSAEPQRTVIAPEREAGKTLADIHEADAAHIPPHDADAAKARVDSELRRAHVDIPEDIAHEVESELARLTAEIGRNAAAELGAAPGADNAGTPGLHEPGGEPEPQPAGGGVGAQHGAERQGVASAGGEGAGLRDAASRSGNREEPQPVPLAPTPVPDLSRSGESRWVSRDGNIRVENLTSTADLVRAIDESAARVGTQGPGRITTGELLDAAEAIDIDPHAVTEAKLATLFGGAQGLSAKVLKLRQAIVASAQIVSDAMKAVRDGGTDADVAAFAVAMSRHDMMQSVLSGVTAETGRTLGMSFKNLEGWQQAADLNEFLKENTGRTLFQLKMIAKLGAKLNTPAKVSKFLRDAQQRSAGGMLLEEYVNALISGPSTHMTYLIGNKILMIQEAVPETLLASAIGRIRVAAGRPGEYVRPGEAWEQVKALGRVIPKALQGGLEAVRAGQATLLPGQEARPLSPFYGDTALTLARNVTNDPVTWHEFATDLFSALRGVRDGVVGGASLIASGGEAGAPAIGAHWSPLGQIPDIAIRGVPTIPVGSLIRVPGRLVAAIHSMDTIANYSRQIAARAYREGVGLGLSGNDLADHIGQRIKAPPDDWMTAAHEQAYASTLMAPGGAMVRKLSEFVNSATDLPILGKTRPLKFIDPFVHIGANVINQAVLRRTPLGAILSPEIRADLMGHNGNIAQDTALARMLAGTALSIVFGSLAMDGYITGSEPSDPHRALMSREVYQAHSVRIGDMWYQMNRLGPMGMLMGIAADMYDVAHDASQGDMLLAASHLQHAVTQNILDESFMRGPADLIRAVEDPGRYGEAYLKQFVSSFLPFSVGLAQMARASDPYTRQARTVIDAIKQKVPGWSETLLPRRNVWGEEIPNADALLHAGLTAVYEKKVNTDPVNQAMLDLGIYPALPERKIRNVELSEQQYDDFARIAGRMTKMRLDAIVHSPDWRTWPNGIRHDVISEVLRQSRESARGRIMMQSPEIPREAADAKMKRATGN